MIDLLYKEIDKGTLEATIKDILMLLNLFCGQESIVLISNSAPKLCLLVDVSSIVIIIVTLNTAIMQFAFNGRSMKHFMVKLWLLLL